MSLYDYYNPPPHETRQYRAWWGSPGAADYVTVTFSNDGRSVDEIGRALLGRVPTGTEVVG